MRDRLSTVTVDVGCVVIGLHIRLDIRPQNYPRLFGTETEGSGREGGEEAADEGFLLVAEYM